MLYLSFSWILFGQLKNVSEWKISPLEQNVFFAHTTNYHPKKKKKPSLKIASLSLFFHPPLNDHWLIVHHYWPFFLYYIFFPSNQSFFHLIFCTYSKFFVLSFGALKWPKKKRFFYLGSNLFLWIRIFVYIIIWNYKEY